MNKFITSILCVALLHGCNTEKGPGIDLIVDSAKEFKSIDDATNFVIRARANKISSITPNLKYDAYYGSMDNRTTAGELLYDSDYEARIFHALNDEAHHPDKTYIITQAWFPLFHDYRMWVENPEWRLISQSSVNDEEYFINPAHPGARAYLKEQIIYIAENFDFDVIKLDWGRFDDFDMPYDEFSIGLYNDAYPYDKMSLNNFDPKNKNWNEWRTTLIANFYAEIDAALNDIDPSIKLAAFVLSSSWTEVAQDPRKYSPYLDYVGPMAYHRDFGEGWLDIYWIFGKSEYKRSGDPSADPIIYGLIERGVREAKIHPTLGSNTFTDASFSEVVEILKGIKKSFPKIDLISYFPDSNRTWDDEEMKEIRDAHRKAF